MAYVIKFNSVANIGAEYFTGRRYIFQGEKYAALDRWDNAKIYKSQKVAERTARTLNDTCAQRGIFNVIPLGER